MASFEVKLNAAIQTAVNSVATAYPGRVKYGDIYPTSVARNCKGTTPNAKMPDSSSLRAGNGTGPGGYISTATFHPTKAGQKVYAKAIEAAFNSLASARMAWTAAETQLPGDWPVGANTDPVAVSCPLAGLLRCHRH